MNANYFGNVLSAVSLHVCGEHFHTQLSNTLSSSDLTPGSPDFPTQFCSVKEAHLNMPECIVTHSVFFFFCF